MDANNVWLPFKKKQTITRGASAYVTTYNTHDVYGNPTSISEVGDNGKVRNTTLTYWANPGNNIVIGKQATKTITGSFSGTSTESYLYNTDGTLQKQTLNGVVTDFTYHKTNDILNGDLKTTKDANGRITTYEWNNGRIFKIINPIYTVSRIINSDGTVASETNGRGFTTTYLYDKLLRLTKITPPAGNMTNITYPSDSSYRQEQRGSFWTKQLYDGFGRSRGAADSKGVVTTVAYKANGLKDYASSNIGDKVSFDDLQRPIQYLHLDYKFVQQSYDGNKVTVTDELPRPTELTYQSFGNPDEKFLASIKDAKNNITSYDYNILGKLTKITAGALSRTFGYDPVKFFLSSESNLETGSISYGRDLVGNLTSVTDGSGTTTYVYDAINRLDYITKAGKTIDYTFDNADNRTGLSAPGANLTFTYDAVNRQISKTEQFTGITIPATIYFDYDANDNLEYITYPSGRKIQNLYNGNNQVVSVKDVTDPNSPRIYVSGITYNVAGQPVNGYTLGNGLTPNHTYTNRFFPKDVAAGNVVDLTYAYYDTGNVSTITNRLNVAKSQSFNYDELNRLTIFNGAWGSGSFDYDRHGNRLWKSVGGQTTNYVINADTYRLDNSTGAEQNEYYYNGIGQVSSSTYEGKNYIYTFDTFNNLETITSPPYTFGQYTYDGDGLRVTKSSDAKMTIYHYDPFGNLLAENVTDGSLNRDYVYLNGKLLARIDSDTRFLGSKIGTFRNGTWYFDANGNGAWDSGSDTSFEPFGMAGDIPVTGDWNHDGKTDMGVFRSVDGMGTWYFDDNGVIGWQGGSDNSIVFGMGTDIPVTGDWNHDGKTDMGVFRNVDGIGRWYFDSDGVFGWQSGSDSYIDFGMGTDIPVTGDWNHDGKTDMGVFRNVNGIGRWYFDSDGVFGWQSGSDSYIDFGMGTDIPVTGDWNNDGTTDIGVFRGGAWYIGTLSGALDKIVPSFGFSTDSPFAWK